MDQAPLILFVKPWKNERLSGIEVMYELQDKRWRRFVSANEFTDELHHLFNVALAAYRELEGAVERAGYGRRAE